MKQNLHQDKVFYMEMLLLGAAFAIVLVIITRVFAAAAVLSHRTAQLNEAVILASNTAEALAISEDYETVWCPASTEGLSVQVDSQSESAAAGALRSYTITVVDAKGEMIYSLDTAVFRGEVSR